MNYKPYFLIKLLITGFLLSGSLQVSAQDRNWTHFRGSNLNGIALNENIPLKWDETSIRWKVPVHDRGYSSPVVFNNQVWLTTAKADGSELYAVCADYETGKIIHDIKVFTPVEVERKHSLNSYATPTPALEQGFVYVHYGSMGTACINTADGSIVWKVTDLKCKHVQGPASSPIIYKNLIILHYEGTDVRYLVALEKATGKLVWKTDRPMEPYEPLTVIGRKAYVTPIIINVKGRDLLISNGSAICIAYDPLTGGEIWQVIGGAESTVSMPFTEKGRLFWYTGFMVGSDGTKYADMIAVNPDGRGDITKTNIIWKRSDELASNQMLSPVIKDGLIYTVTSRNVMMCIDASDGKEIWSKHVTSNYNASPLYINGNIWFFSIKGEVLVLKAGKDYKVVSQSSLESGIWATPAILRNSAIVRTENFLYRIGG